jgi:hypothetical protein
VKRAVEEAVVANIKVLWCYFHEEEDTKKNYQYSPSPGTKKAGLPKMKQYCCLNTDICMFPYIQISHQYTDSNLLNACFYKTAESTYKTLQGI